MNFFRYCDFFDIKFHFYYENRDNMSFFGGFMSIGYLVISILITVLIPIIPTILSGILGYIVKLLSSKMKHKKLVQMILTGLLIIALIAFSSVTGDLVTQVAKHATSINDFLTKLYYPIGAYISLITKFDIIILIKLVLIHIIPLILFILIGQKYYFRILILKAVLYLKRELR